MIVSPSVPHCAVIAKVFEMVVSNVVLFRAWNPKPSTELFATFTVCKVPDEYIAPTPAPPIALIVKSIDIENDEFELEVN